MTDRDAREQKPDSDGKIYQVSKQRGGRWIIPRTRQYRTKFLSRGHDRAKKRQNEQARQTLSRKIFECRQKNKHRTMVIGAKAGVNDK